MKKIISAVMLNIALVTNSLAQEPPPEIYQETNSKITLENGYYHTKDNINRPLELKADTGFYVTNQPTTINSTISSITAGMPTPLWKLGTGHLQINGDNTYDGNTRLLEGSLGLGHDNALGSELNMFEMVSGTKLILAPNVVLKQNLNLLDSSSVIVPAGWPMPVDNARVATIQVDSGTAMLNGNLFGAVVLDKVGAGTLGINGLGFTFAELNLKQGGLEVNGLWFDTINTMQNTLLSGTGTIGVLNLAGVLQPGTASQTGQINFNEINMADNATTIIRIKGGDNYDSIYSSGVANLNGTLNIQPLNKQIPNGIYTIVSANDLRHSRFMHIISPKQYISPQIQYNDTDVCDFAQSCQTVILSMQYNNLGLNYAEPNWLAATIMDSRFARDTAIQHSATGMAWGRGWFANSEWGPSERDTSGVQIGNSFKLNKHSYLAVFAGAQQNNWRKGEHINDNSLHAGITYSHTVGPVQMSLGHIISQHKAKIRRIADPYESSIKSSPRAINNQTWAYAELKQGLALNNQWAIKPFIEINHTHSKRLAYKEHGSQAAIKSPSQNYSLWASRLGLNIESHWSTKYGDATMQTSLGLAHNWGGGIKSKQQYIADDKFSYTVSSRPVPKTSLRLDMGINAPIAKHSNIHLAYTGEHSTKQKQHGVWGGVEARF